MAINDIPEYVEAIPGDLIRADNWNAAQRQARQSLRTHQHTRVAGAAVNDASNVDTAQQIDTNEIADGAVTAAKLAVGAISGSSLPDGSITTPKLAPGAVTAAKLAANTVATANLQSNAVTASKINFDTVNSGGVEMTPGSNKEIEVQLDAPNVKTTVYFPQVVITDTSGTGLAKVEAEMQYRQTVGSDNIDVFIHLRNFGSATADVFWQVMTFAQ